MVNDEETMKHISQTNNFTFGERKDISSSRRVTARLATQANESLFASGGYLNSQTSDTQVFGGFSPYRSDGSPARKKTKIYLSQLTTPSPVHESIISGHDNGHLEFMIVDIHEQIDLLSSKIEDLDASATEAQRKRKELEETVGKLMGLRLMRLKTALQPESGTDLSNNISPGSDRSSNSSDSAFPEEDKEAETLSPGASQEIDGTISTQYLGQLAREFFGQ